MGYIYRLPFILGSLITIIIGYASYKSRMPLKDIYMKMIFSMMIFTLIGFWVRSCITKLVQEIERRKEEERKEEKRKEEEQKALLAEQEEEDSEKSGNTELDEGDNFKLSLDLLNNEKAGHASKLNDKS